MQPDEGEILVDGEPIAIHGPHARDALGFAFVHQELADVPNLTVAENVELGLGYPRRRGCSSTGGRCAARRATPLERLGAGSTPRRPARSLSVAAAAAGR